MSIYDKSIAALSTPDLNELLLDKAVENVRLEFKRDPPARDETLKKLSSFANTYGGYLVIGAEASSADGRITDLPGVDPEPGYKQRLIQWCFDGASPPVVAFVSDPIPSPTAPERVCYVIFVPESQEAPHFLNSRKGIYVRTDEFSQRFEARLATFSEITHLANRREAAVARRTRLFDRSVERFDTLVATAYQEFAGEGTSIGGTMELFLCPLFPVVPLREEKDLPDIVRSSTLNWRSVGFPRPHERITQHESIIVPRAGGAFSSFEMSIWGHLYYAYEIEHQRDQTQGIHLPAFVAHLLVFLEHARNTYQTIGYDGTLEVRLVLKRIRNQHWIYFSHGFPEQGPASTLDDEVAIRLELSSAALHASRDTVLKDLLRSVLFALNWHDAALKADTVDWFIDQGYHYNGWKRQTNGGAA